MNIVNWFFDKGAKAIQWRKASLSIYGAGTTGCLYVKKINLDITLYLSQKWTPNWSQA